MGCGSSMVAALRRRGVEGNLPFAKRRGRVRSTQGMHEICHGVPVHNLPPPWASRGNSGPSSPLMPKGELKGV